MRLFFDTSALAKRYVQEQGSARVQNLCERADAILLSIICLPELISTLCRLVREERINPHDYHNVKQSILADLGDMDVYPIGSEVMGHAIRCLENHPLRAMDAIHLGCALVSEPDAFVSSDRRQIEAARGEGLNVIEVSA
jgi:uncharacterized protein